MKQEYQPKLCARCYSRWVLLATFFVALGCQRSSQERPSGQQLTSTITVRNSPIGVVIETPKAEFELLRSGYVKGYLKQNAKRLTLDDPQQSGGENVEYAAVGGKEVRDFITDWAHTKISDAGHRLGARGKRVEVWATSVSLPELERTVAFEVYDEFPGLLLSTTSYKNGGRRPLALEQVVTQSHRFNASLPDPKAPPHRMWSFYGSSEQWGKDDLALVSQRFSRANPMEQVMPGDPGTGGGIPVVAFWTASVGESIGHLETLPLVLSLPVKVAADQRIDVAIQLDPRKSLAPGDVYSTPVTFLAVYKGDFYEPLRTYSKALGAQGLKMAQPSTAAYEANWCGWGYELKFTPEQVVGTIPKLKELGLKWATLDAGWFNNRGDWQPRPGLTVQQIKELVDKFHKTGIRITLWWIPIVVEDGEKRDVLDHRPYHLAEVVKIHPEWLILDKSGKHARMTAGLAGLCPAVPEVQQYYKQLTERFIRDWDFDGHKLDFAFAVPACYNPKHHHSSPEDSTRAMGEIYNIIFQSTRALKPDSVTQSCPCGTPPNLAWLPYMDQAVTADPVGSVQVRRRIKMYKALLGPEAAVYGDHVELTRIAGPNTQHEHDIGQDFASTVGVGGVVGTKFTWPDYGPKIRNVYLTQEKEAYWKKWVEIYNQKMLSRGTFRNLYTYGYDFPEAYAIEKDGRMYYGFFASQDAPQWKGTLELRGLKPGKYRVIDYVNGRDLGTVDGENPRLSTGFREHLLLEVSAQ